MNQGRANTKNKYVVKCIELYTGTKKNAPFLYQLLLILLVSIPFVLSSLGKSKADESTDINSIIKGQGSARPSQKQPAAEVSTDANQKRKAFSKDDIVKLDTKASVFIISINDDAKENKTSLATGFFIKDDLIFTNAHVVEDANRLFAIDAEAHHYTLKKIAVGDSDTGTDFAVLQTDSSDKHQILTLNTDIKQLDDVYAFGFPGIATLDDPTLRAIMNGDKKLSPNVVISSGVVQETRDNDNNIEIIMHSAKIAPGNSGGPLLNTCGQVIGVNTYLKNQEAEVQTVDGKAGTAKVDAGYSFSLHATEIEKFIKKRAIEMARSFNRCGKE